MRLLYFASVPWDSYAQRPHYIVRYFLERRGEAALWVDPYPTRLPALGDLHRLHRVAPRPAKKPENLDVVGVPALPVEPFPGGAWLNRRLLWREVWERLRGFAEGGDLIVGVGRPSALALEALERLSPARSFYDAMDDFPEFYRGLSRRSMRRTEEKIVEHVRMIYVSSSRLFEKFAGRRLRPVRLANACDAASLPPPGLRPAGAPVFGYVGTIAAWFDWAVVARLARAFPEGRVRLVGPCFSPPPTGLPGNVELLPECPHEEAVRHLATFSAGLIPFKRTPLTSGVDPIKYYEYRAMGLPILATSFGEMALRGEKDGLFFLDRGEDVKAAAAAALEHHMDLGAVGEFRKQNDWTARLEKVGQFLDLTG